MKTYKVQREYTVWFEVEIEAKDELEAVEKSIVEFDDGMGLELDGRCQTGQYWVEEDTEDLSADSYSGSLSAIEDIILPRRKMKEKAAELGLPLVWVEEIFQEGVSK